MACTCGTEDHILSVALYNPTEISANGYCAYVDVNILQKIARVSCLFCRGRQGHVKLTILTGSSEILPP